MAKSLTRVGPIAKAGAFERMRQLRDLGDRESAILAHAFVDAALEDAIKSRFRKEHDPKIFSSAPLGNFIAKVKIAHALGIIPTCMVYDLHGLADIRNYFAHSIMPITFESGSELFEKGNSPAEIVAKFRLPDDDGISRWFASLSEEITTSEAPWLNGIIIADQSDCVIMGYGFNKDELKTTKGRFLATAGLATTLLTVVSLQKLYRRANEVEDL